MGSLEQRRFSRKSETNSVWSKGKNFFQNRTKGIIWSKLKYDSWSFQIGPGFQSGNIFILVLPFWTKYVLNEQSSLNSMLTSNGTYLGEEDYTKAVDNFDRFPESINTPLSDKWFRSNGFWKFKGCCWKFQLSGQINMNRLIWRLSLHPDKKWGNSEHQDCRRLSYLSKEW
jgi:hypothetical protein